MVLVLQCYTVSAQTVDFTQSGFSVVQGSGNVSNSYQYLGVTPEGYFRHRLTLATTRQSTALWNYTPIDLSKDYFVIDFRLNFGTRDIGGADGFVFVIHQLGHSVLGSHGGGIGYAGIGRQSSNSSGILPYSNVPIDSTSIDFINYSNSFLSSNLTGGSLGIEFDSYDNEVGYGFNDLNDKHISFLRNGTMLPIDGQCIPIREDNLTVKDGGWYCVRIIGKKEGSGYRLTVYVAAPEDPNKVLKQRHTMYFPTIDSLFPGVSEQNPLVTWGITSSTGGSYNTQQVDFISMSNGDSGVSGTINLLNKGSVDTLYHNSLNLSGNFKCGVPIVTPLSALIVNERTICNIGFNVLEFLDIDLNGAKFYLKNKNTPDFDSVAGAVNNKFNFTQYLTDTNYLLDRNSNGINYILIKVELKDGRVLNFKINFRELVLVNHFIGLSDSLSMEIMPGGFNGSMLVTNNILNSIPVPEDCAYEIAGYRYDNFIDDNYPKYFEETNDIRFILKPNVCREQIIITRVCDANCPPPVHYEQFSIDIKGKECRLRGLRRCRDFRWTLGVSQS